MNWKSGVFFLAILLCPAITAAAQPETPAWRWDRATRLAERYDGVRAHERAIAAKDRCGGPCTGKIVVDGSRDPALLTPLELMDTLAGAYDASDAEIRANARNIWSRRAASLTLPADFWQRLYDVGQPFFDAWTDYVQINSRLTSAPAAERDRLKEESEEILRSLCARRAAALDAARASFGQELFDQFLYDAIAPGVFIVESGAVRGAQPLEGGCHP